MNSPTQSLADTIVVLLQYGDPALTQKTLAHLCALSPGATKLRAIVIESGSLMRVRQLPETERVSPPKNRGYGAAANAGLCAAFHQGAAFVILLNNDVVLSPGSLEAMRSAARPEVGMVGVPIHGT